jgi:heme/copper-type cytochrome/quinol oxidase subunit 2
MIFAASITAKAVENFNKSKTENYQGDSCGNGSSLAFLIISVVFLVVEIVMLYFALKIALASGKTNTSKFVHVVLALTMTLPYVLLSVLLNPDARAALDA